MVDVRRKLAEIRTAGDRIDRNEKFLGRGGVKAEVMTLFLIAKALQKGHKAAAEALEFLKNRASSLKL